MLSYCQATETLFRMAVTRGFLKPIKHGEVRTKAGNKKKTRLRKDQA